MIRAAQATRWPILAAMLWVGCGPRERGITLFYTNDIHATYGPSPAVWVDGEPLVGGFVSLRRQFERERKGVKHWLLLDGGDLLSGGPAGDLVYRGVQGGHMIRFMNALGYDAMSLGNHDLDFGADNLSRALSLASFPVLAANVLNDTGTPLTGAGWVVFRRGGLRVGVIGVVTNRLEQLVSRATSARFEVLQPGVVSDSLARFLDPRTDLLVVLSHCGLEVDRYLARRLGPVVDVIVGGHSHDRLETPEEHNGVIIVQAGTKLRYLGRLDLEVREDRAVNYENRLILLDDTVSAPSVPGSLAWLADSLDASLEAAYGDTVGEIATRMGRSYHRESALGNWVADALRWYADADVAFVNSGTFRSDVLPGPLTIRQIREVVPFANTVVTFSCTGRELDVILRHNVEAAIAESHGILQVSGCSCRATVVGTDTIMETALAGMPIKPDSIYKCATVDFVASAHSQRYLGMVPSDVYDHSILLSSAVERAVRAKASLGSVVEGRLVLDGVEARRGEKS
ncbi:bifunctional metallophosphatase/5'-nucleotidase [Candidatus Fermentibacteria bacterium]|nr:bifunctional metallophosphatase/5'-nucleotidase [Candidatus Fermentibacteria bacterium]